MEKISCIVIVGKPGAGKSSIGSCLAKNIGGKYMSLGSFMRENLNIPDPHIGVDKHPVYDELHRHCVSDEAPEILILDCHPYPEDDFVAFQSFITRPSLELKAVIHVAVSDEIALKRLEQRPRPGQSYADRIQYFNEHRHFIEMLTKHPLAIEIENDIDFDDLSSINYIVDEICTKLKQR